MALLVIVLLLVGIALGNFSSSKQNEVGTTLIPLTTERAAQESPSRALLEAMVNGVREGVLVIDEEMRVIASNSAAHAIFNRAEEKREAVRLSSLTRNSAIHSAFSTALEQRVSTEVKVELQGEERRSFDMRVVPLSVDTGRSISRAAIGVFFDITRLERLEQVRQEFLSNVSHELRTPLTSILAFVETLEEGAIDDAPNSRRFLSVIRKNAVRMHHLINDILELSSIEAGTARLKTERVRLRPVVDDIIGALKVKAESRRVRLCNRISADEMVRADPRRLEQMLTNLIDNAIKFNREGGSVTITFERGERDRICVSDTGEGIPGEHIERVFERFYRVDRARTLENGGTGLGLAIVKHLARAHGGEVSVRSTSNEGSTFTIELPCAETIAVADVV
ncbi:MAG: two-component system, OmpR family, phosphate regulon sensor histidine kinase PhoR [Acidobacteriota bacterium]|jgi:two-component system phosphate regulon sensor histidine kinase PhoR|nr:two-component system, OmpR family, phosphate regulon sensor histidine kinase PhoR [Acidobacteriota bacterium]